jgi:hypothetical protein
MLLSETAYAVGVPMFGIGTLLKGLASNSSNVRDQYLKALLGLVGYSM